MKIEETHGEPFHEAGKEIIFLDKKRKGDTFNGKKKTSEKRADQILKIGLPVKKVSSLPTHP